MRKLTLQMQMTLDGFVARPNGEQDWMTLDQDDELKAVTIAKLDSSDIILLGRKNDR